MMETAKVSQEIGSCANVYRVERRNQSFYKLEASIDEELADAVSERQDQGWI